MIGSRFFLSGIWANANKQAQSRHCFRTHSAADWDAFARRLASPVGSAAVASRPVVSN